ncbi:hypothetical protein OIU79_000153 [Salix purpurea]|uniref:Uncharacterized protein n=1 Tax=Salix purpurea TaxID=77065 RepID=A0A9Q0V1D6_SALPP|nr:hypothetical protein OIU79_000153 [Salix purpurea]
MEGVHANSRYFLPFSLIFLEDSITELLELDHFSVSMTIWDDKLMVLKRYQQTNMHLQPRWGNGEKETREEHWGAILELYEKLPQSIKTQVNLDKFDVPRNLLRDMKVDSSSQRSADEGSTIEKLSRKLERFKIRTVQGGGVVRVEEDRS